MHLGTDYTRKRSIACSLKASYTRNWGREKELLVQTCILPLPLCLTDSFVNQKHEEEKKKRKKPPLDELSKGQERAGSLEEENHYLYVQPKKTVRGCKISPIPESAILHCMSAPHNRFDQ